LVIVGVIVQSDQFHRVTKGVADPRRYEILQAIARSDEAACSDLRCHFPISAATLSHHIKELSTAGFLHLHGTRKRKCTNYGGQAGLGSLLVMASLESDV
jgi:DNA-binding transcriptional ArsR family regulator